MYQKIDFTGEPSEPDQLHLLHGGPPTNMDCERCGDQLHIVGEMSAWEIMNQPGVSLANRDQITEARQKELEEEQIVILACPACKKKYQWAREFLP